MNPVFPSRVHDLIAAGAFDIVDAYSVREILTLAGVPDASEQAWLLAGLTLRAYRDGHSRLNLDDESLESWRPDDVTDWIDRSAARAAMDAFPTVFGDDSGVDLLPRRPFVESHDGLYIARVLHEEIRIAEWMRRDNGANVTIILGGPGTGKTYTIAERLRTYPSPMPKVALCAPTGKASRHLKTVLDRQLRENGASREVLDVIADAPSETAHRLLGANPNGRKRYRHDEEFPLDHRLVIVDEASMMSLSLMHSLLRAVPAGGEIWLVGDPDQLASVDAGSVLADIRRAAAPESNFLHARTTVLDEQRRFAADSGIAALANAVRDKDLAAVRSVLESGAADIEWIDPSTDRDAMSSLVDLVVGHARSVIGAAAGGDFAAALTTKSRLQVLTATRSGRFGVDGWNELVERRLGPSAASRSYIGRPVMVTRNDRPTRLSNGDVGIVCSTINGERAFFGDPADPTEVPFARLPDVTTVHALTIHKSQGSEFDHAVVVVPPGENRVLTRELLYTGITRPRTRLTLVATWDSIEKAVERDARRATGLERRLRSGNPG